MDISRALVELNPDGVLGFDREYRYTLWNPAMERISGLCSEEVLGRKAFDLFPFLREIGEDRYLAEALSGEISISRDRPYRVRQTGHVGYFDGYYLPLREADGGIVGAIGLIRDVTTRHRAEALARESRELFESYMAHIPGVAFMKDADGRHVYANRAFEETHGLKPREWEGKVDSEIFPPDTAARFRADDLEVLRAGMPLRMVDTKGARAEPEHWMWIKFPFADAAGRRFVAGLAFNITEQHRAEQALRASEEQFKQLFSELQQANRRKDEFLATLSHELRNPLAPLLTAAELIRIHPASDPVLLGAQEVIGRQAQQMRRLIDDLLDVARITRGIVSLQLTRIDMRDAVREAVQTARPSIEAREHGLAVSMPSEPIWVDADSVRLEQVITNLLSNASKFTPPGGQIEVRLERSGDSATITVADTGKGIPPEMLSRVFDLFTQVNPSLDRAEGGLGLGLTLVKRLIEMHDGSVSVVSAGEGLGAEFAVRLPLQPPPEAAPRFQMDGVEESDDGCRVLIVDDNVDSAEMLKLMLPGWGYVAATAYSGPAALEQADRFEPDVILLDIGLPGMSGYEVAQLLHETRHARVPLVALTGYGQDEDRRRTHAAGFAAHLTKPVDLEVLRGVLASLRPRG